MAQAIKGDILNNNSKLRRKLVRLIRYNNRSLE